MIFGSARIAAAWGFAILSMLCAVRASAGPGTAEDYMKPPFIDDVALSPSGKRLALVAPTAKGRRQLAVMELDPVGSIKLVAGFGEADVYDVRWVNDERLVFRASDPEKDFDAGDSGVFAVNADGTDQRQLIARIWRNNETNSMIRSRLLTWQWDLVQTLRDGSADVIVEQYRFDAKGDTSGVLLSRLNTRTGELRSLGAGAPDGVRQWLLDHQGEPRMVTAVQGDARVLYLRESSAQPWSEVARFPVSTYDGFEPARIDHRGQVYAFSSPGGGPQALYRFDAKTRQLEREPLVTLRGFDLEDDFEVDADTQRLLGVHLRMEQPGTYWFDPELAKLQHSLDAALPPGRDNRLICDSHCNTSRFIVVRSRSDRQPGEYYLFDRQGMKLQKLASARPWLDESAQGRRSFHRVAARDGLSLPVYVTRPAQAPAGKALPTVMLVHGGPFVRGHDLDWDAEAQFLASRGYLVLEADFRGSQGYGFDHFRAGWKQWGRAMQDDLADVVAWSIKQGATDAKRVCIAGASYGGYAALMGPIHDPDLYRCAVSFAGVTDIALMYDIHWSDLPDQYKRYGMPTLIGDRVADAAKLAEVSPLKQVGRIKVPVLLAHGGIDHRVPIEHAKEFLAAAERAGVKVEWVPYYDEGHGWNSPADRIDFWARVEKFLAASMSDTPP